MYDNCGSSGTLFRTPGDPGQENKEPRLVDINKDSRLDTSQIDDQRGRRMGGVGGAGGIALGGGGIGLVVTILLLLFGGNLTGSSGGAFSSLQDQSIDSGAPAGSTLSQDCQTGADAQNREDCRIVAYVNSIQKYWTDEFAARGKNYVPVKTTFFTDQFQTGCGPATSDVGPFYCPVDKRVYIDLGFFDDLKTKFGATGRPVRAGVRAGARIRPPFQDLQARSTESAQGRRRRRGVGPDWSSRRTATPGYGRPMPCRPASSRITDADIADGLNAAAAVGDDRIQQEFQGRVSPESGRTAHRRSASSGSRPATNQATSAPATRSAAVFSQHAGRARRASTPASTLGGARSDGRRAVPAVNSAG